MPFSAPAPRTWLTLLLMLLGLVLAPSCSQQEMDKPVVVKLAVLPSLASGLIAVAQGEGFFKQMGLEVQMELIPAGDKCLDSLLEGKVQLATASHYVLTRGFAQNKNLRVLTALSTNDLLAVTARRESGITVPEDLRGKKIGLPMGNITRYQLENFLMLHGMGPQDVTMVNLAPENFTQALASGDVDATCGWMLLAWEANKHVKGLITWGGGERQAVNFLLATRTDSGLSQEELKRFLTALLMAQDECQTSPIKARETLVRTWTNLDPGYLAQIWDRSGLRLSLGEGLYLSLEHVAQWLGEKGLSNSTETLDFQLLIDSKPLRAVAPGQVTLFHQTEEKQ